MKCWKPIEPALDSSSKSNEKMRNKKNKTKSNGNYKFRHYNFHQWNCSSWRRCRKTIKEYIQKKC